MDAIIRSRLADGLNYYKEGPLTLEQTLNGFEEVLKDYSPVEPEVKPACVNCKIEDDCSIRKILSGETAKTFSCNRYESKSV